MLLVSLGMLASIPAFAADPPAQPTAPTPEPVAAPATPSVSKAEFDALQQRLAQVEAQLAKATPATPAPAPPARDLEFDLDGYYRARGYYFSRLFAPDDDGAFADSRYMQMRLRLQPNISYKKDLAKFYLQIDALDDVMWGDNQSLASTAVFASAPSNTNIEGQEIPSIAVSRAWLDVKIPVGSVRVGRMTNSWGMGLLANSGDGFPNTWGESHSQSTADRVLFATRPIAIVQKIMHKEDTNIPLFVAAGVDRLVEDPLIQYFGYKCRPGIAPEDEDYDPRCASQAGQPTDQTNDYTEDRDPADRTQTWWADQTDDVMENVFIVIYRGENIKYLGAPGDITAGVFIINRNQKETDSTVWIYDFYTKIKNRWLRVEFEGLTIQGHTNAIALPGAFDPSGQTEDPLFKTANIWGYVGRVGYEDKLLRGMFETGYASGDDNVADAKFTGRPLHPDHNAGLILYDQVISRVTANAWGDTRGLWSNGGVYNSRYIFPQVRVTPKDNLELHAGFLAVWPDKPDGAIIRCAKASEGCASVQATSALIGTEVDIAVKLRWHEHMLFSLEGGYAHATDRLPLEQAGLNPEGNFLTLQSRIAYQF